MMDYIDIDLDEFEDVELELIDDIELSPIVIELKEININ